MGDIIVLALLAAVVSGIVVAMIKNRKNGKKCSCGCASCEKRYLCHPNEVQE